MKFLYNPALGIGNSQTWLLGTQGAGYWRTTDSGATWTKVSDNNITHGGSTIYYAQNKVLYASGRTMHSSDNGATWTNGRPGRHVVRARRRQDALHRKIVRRQRALLDLSRNRRRDLDPVQYAEVPRWSVRDGLRRGERHHVLVELVVGGVGAESRAGRSGRGHGHGHGWQLRCGWQLRRGW